MQAWHSITASSVAAYRRTALCVSLVRPSRQISKSSLRNVRCKSSHTVAENRGGLVLRLRDSRTQRKSTRPSSTPVLVDVLRSAGHDFALPKDLKLHHVDLSYIKVGNDFKPRLRTAQLNRDEQRSARSESSPIARGITFQAILAKYVRHAHGEGSDRLYREEEDSEPSLGWEKITNVEDKRSIDHKSLQDVHDPSGSRLSSYLLATEEKFLREEGYNHENVIHWAEILCEERSDVAARKMLAYLRDNATSGRRQLPVFVLLFFLRRSHLDPEALRFCLIIGWQEVNRRRSYLQSPEEYAKKNFAHGPVPVWDDHSLYLLIVRLLRHARIVWSETLVTIAAMFSQYVKDSTLTPTRPLTAAESTRLTLQYNRVLSLISLPLSQRPFHSIMSQERAQFDLLRDMTLYDPPLQINREGYRAIVSVQLAQKKTSQERDWDNLKARSWPPWKQDKTGLDADKDRAYGTSRAMHVLNRSQEAGYGPMRWESTASILAGWDVNGSPTIQKRALLLHKVVSNTSASTETEPIGIMRLRKASDPALYTARISSARTLQEAWAFFLQYKAENPHPNIDVYLATLFKIAAEDERVSVLRSGYRKTNPHLLVENRPLNSGDTAEVVAAPNDPNEATYLKSPPLSFDELAMEMFNRGLKLQGRRLASLLSIANNLENGVKYLLKAAGVKSSDLYSLVAESPENDERLKNVDPAIFNAWIEFLCRFPIASDKSDPVHAEEHTPLLFLYHDRPVIYALRLLRARKPTVRPPWHAVLRTLGKPYVTARLRRLYKKNNPHRFEHSAVVQGVLHSMSQIGIRPDQGTLHIICRALEPAIIDAQDIVADVAARRVVIPTSTPVDTTATADDIQMTVSDAARLLGQSPQYIQSIFNTVMGVGSRKASSEVTKAIDLHKLPRLLATPTAESLHAYMRVLGVLQDWQGIFNLLAWMVKYQGEIAAATQMPRNGPRLLRRTLVAARVYLERSWVALERGDGDADEAAVVVDLQRAPDRTVANIRRMIEQTAQWGGWPSDEEVGDYCALGRFPVQGQGGKRVVQYQL